MIDFSPFRAAPCWYEEAGPDSDIVVSGKVGISRNLSGFAYPHLLTADIIEKLVAKIETALQENGVCKDFVRYDLEKLTEIEVALLAEEGRSLSDPEFRRTSLFVAGDGRISVEVNAKDHLRISSLRGGLNLRGSWTDVDKLDSVLETRLEYAVSFDLGYLTAEIDKLGNALEITALLHLPGISLSGRLEKIGKILAETSFVMKPFLPIKNAGGEFFLISGKSVLGEPEEEIFEKFEGLCISLLNYEREMRHLLFEKRGDFLEDQMCRAYGILERAKFLNYEEAIKLLSLLRMGCCMKRPVTAFRDRVTALIFRSMPAHIRMIMDGGPAENVEERENRARAVFIHQELRNFSLEEEGHCV